MNLKTILNIVLALVCVVLFYLNFRLIWDDIQETKKLKSIKLERVSKLEDIKTCEMDFLEKHGRFTANWDSLIGFMKNGKLYKLKQIGDPDKNPDVVVKYDTFFYNPLETDLPKGYDIDNLAVIPLSDGKKFKLEAGSIIKNNISVPTFQVSDLDSIGKNAILKLGDLNDVKRSGNWK